MRTSPALRLGVRVLRLRVRRSFARSKGGSRASTRYVEFPRKLWDRAILFLFICSLVVFLHALLGFGIVDEDLRALNNTFDHSRAPLSTPPLQNWSSVVVNGIQKTRISRVMVDWHGNYEPLPNTASVVLSPASASIPQDAFPDPTPALARGERGPSVEQGSLFIYNRVDTPAFGTFATPYDPFRLEFEDLVEGGENYVLYPVAGPPRTALQGLRTRRFGRCLPGEACL